MENNDTQPRLIVIARGGFYEGIVRDLDIVPAGNFIPFEDVRQVYSRLFKVIFTNYQNNLNAVVLDAFNYSKKISVPYYSVQPEGIYTHVDIPDEEKLNTPHEFAQYLVNFYIRTINL